MNGAVSARLFAGRGLPDAWASPEAPADHIRAGWMAAIDSGLATTRQSSVRAQGAADDVELIFGSYFLFEALAVLTGGSRGGPPLSLVTEPSSWADHAYVRAASPGVALVVCYEPS